MNNLLQEKQSDFPTWYMKYISFCPGSDWHFPSFCATKSWQLKRVKIKRDAFEESVSLKFNRSSAEENDFTGEA